VVGQDHVAATVNTLVLAYAGAALPTLLLFSISGTAFSQLLNLEFVTEEVVRTVVGSLGLMASVPITTALACWVAVSHHEWGKWARWLGPEGEGHTH
ncbi:MAG TPA: YibE/F family protein, partial [Anaerolineales bacterium]|nr:YibE/F family protein [Anaerolineales bacterium]